GLAKNPADRFARVGDFARALSGAATSSPSQPPIAFPAEAPKPPAPETSSAPHFPPAKPSLSVSIAPGRVSWWRRRRTIVIVGSVLVLFLILAALNSRDRAGSGNAAATDDHGNTIATATLVTPGTHAGTLAPAGD